MTETKYILTGDEPHWSGATIREVYTGTKFPVVATYGGAGSISDTEFYSDVDDPLYKYHVNTGTPVKRAVGGKVESITIKPNYEALFDPVEKPEHYNTNLPEGVEAIDIIAAQTEHLSGLRAVCHANLLKYALRWQKKNGVEDLKKGAFYLNRLIEEIENND